MEPNFTSPPHPTANNRPAPPNQQYPLPQPYPIRRAVRNQAVSPRPTPPRCSTTFRHSPYAGNFMLCPDEGIGGPVRVMNFSSKIAKSLTRWRGPLLPCGYCRGAPPNSSVAYSHPLPSPNAATTDKKKEKQSPRPFPIKFTVVARTCS